MLRQEHRATGTPNSAGWVDAIELPIFDDVESMWTELPAGRARLLAGPRRSGSGRRRPRPEVTGGTWSAVSWPAAAVYFVGMNMTDPTLGADLELRKAISQSADAQTVVDERQRGRRPRSPAATCPQGIPGYKAAQNPYPYDPEAATALVTGAGRRPRT